MSKKILVVVTNQDHYTTTNDPTGLWLSELVHFYHPVKAAGFEMDIASALGGNVPLDPLSASASMMDPITKAHFDNPDFMALLQNSKKISTLSSQDYTAVYFTGGHGTMWDFVASPDIIQMANAIYANDGHIAAVCHGVGALLNLNAPNGRLLIEGKKLTGYTREEEVLAGVIEKVPFILEDALKTKGALYESSPKAFSSFVVADGKLLTGQNPQSTSELAEALLKELL